MSDTINLSTAEVGVLVSGLVGVFTGIAAYFVKINTSHTEDIKQAHKEHREELKAVYTAHNAQLSAIIEKHSQGMERIFQVLGDVKSCLSHFDATIENLHHAIAKRQTDGERTYHDNRD